MAKKAPSITTRMAMIFSLVFGLILFVLLVLGAIANRAVCWACGW